MAGLDGLYRVTLTGVMHGQLVQNSWHFMDRPLLLGATYLDSLTLIMQDWITYIMEPWKDCVSAEYQFRTLGGQVIDPLGPAEQFVVFENEFGIQEAESLPVHDAGLISWRTGHGGRQNRGRTYIAGFPMVHAAHSLLQNPSLSRLVHLADMFVSRWSPNGTSTAHMMGVYSRKRGDLRDPGPPPVIHHFRDGFLPITNALVRQEIKTMGSRDIGRGL